MELIPLPGFLAAHSHQQQQQLVLIPITQQQQQEQVGIVHGSAAAAAADQSFSLSLYPFIQARVGGKISLMQIAVMRTMHHAKLV